MPWHTDPPWFWWRGFVHLQQITSAAWLGGREGIIYQQWLHHSFSTSSSPHQFLSFVMFQVLAKWGEYSNDVQFILQRSPLDPVSKSPSSPSPGQETKGPGYPGMKKSPTFPGTLPPSNQAAIWKSPPGVVSSKPVVSASSGRLSELASATRHLSPEVSARLSPDSGRGSDPTGSDTSNFSDQEKARGLGPGAQGARSSQGPVQGYTPPGWAGLRPGARFTSPSPDWGPEYGYS